LLMSRCEIGGGLWTLKIADFGLAKRLHFGRDIIHHGWAGTVPYMAPEQLDGRFDCSSDVWACGMVFYEMLRGKMLLPDKIWQAGGSVALNFLRGPDFAHVVDAAAVNLQSTDEAMSLLRSLLALERQSRLRAVDALDHEFFVAKRPSAGCAWLPAGWQQLWSADHEAWYFHEGQSGACVWEAPDGALPAAEEPLLLVLPVDDLRRCGLSSGDAEEARLAAVVGSVASGYLVPDLFPRIGDALWADDWHFTEEGAELFARLLAKNLKKYLVSLARYKDGMTVHGISDSTVDFHNWDNKWNWIGKGDVIFKDAFTAEGFVLSLDVAGSTGFCVGTKYAGSFPARLQERREACAACGPAESFDCVLVIGGYNDVHARHRVAEDDLRAGVGETLRECLLLLQSGPSDAPQQQEDHVLDSVAEQRRLAMRQWRVANLLLIMKRCL
jgi:hypothetical protein